MNHPLLEGHHITYEKDGDMLLFRRRQWTRLEIGTSGNLLGVGTDGVAWVAPSVATIAQPYAPGSFTIPTGHYAVMASQLELTGSQTGTIAGTATLVVL